MSEGGGVYEETADNSPQRVRVQAFSASRTASGRVVVGGLGLDLDLLIEMDEPFAFCSELLSLLEDRDRAEWVLVRHHVEAAYRVLGQMQEPAKRA